MRTIAVINQKGGVGKTTTVANLGAAIAARGHDILVVDLDPQAHLTLHLGVEPGKPAVSMYNVLAGNSPLAEAMLQAAPHLWVAPSTIDMAAAEVELAGTVGREQILRDRIAEAPLDGKLVMIDCPPSLGLLTLNALAAATDVVIPLQPHFLALQGLGKLLETVALVQRRINPALKVTAVVLCMWETNTRLSAEVHADLKAFFDAARGSKAPWSDVRILDSVIRRNVKLAECPSYGKTIFDYEPTSRGAEDHAALADEFLGVLGIAAPPPQAPGQETHQQAQAPSQAPPGAPAQPSEPAQPAAPAEPQTDAAPQDGAAP